MASTLNDYYKSIGQALPTVGARAKIYESSGIGSASTYQGTAQQNTALLNVLQKNSPAKAPATTAANTIKPTSATGVAPYLNDYQTKLLDEKSSPLLKTPAVQTPDQVKAQLTPTGGAPTPINRVDTRAALNEEYGVAALEQKLNDFKAQEDQLAAQSRTNTTAELGKPVALNVISGRITEEQRQAQEQQSFISQEKARVVDQLNTTYKIIDQYVQDKGLDYGDAVAQYDKEYKQNLDVYSIIQGEEKQANDVFLQNQNIAKANLQVYTNAITSGNLTYSSLSSDQKLMVSKLEIQSGLPVGFIGSLQMSPKDRLMAVSDDKSQAWVIGSDGNMKVVPTGLSGSSKAGEPAGGVKFQSAIQQGIGDLKQGESWGTVYNRIKSQFPNIDASMIDNGLGTEWRNPGAFEKYKTTQTTATGSASEISKAKQIIQANGMNGDDLKRVETDPDFRAWVLANYQ